MSTRILSILITLHCSSIISEVQSKFEIAIGGTGSDYASEIIQTREGGFAVAGETFSMGAGYFDFYIVKFNNAGMLQWSKVIGGTGQDEAQSIIQTTDGGYVVTGYTGTLNPAIFVTKLDSGGTLQWNRAFVRPLTTQPYAIVQTNDGGYAVAGVTYIEQGGCDMFIIKLDAGGTLQWGKNVGIGSWDFAFSVTQTTDGGFTLAGSSDGDILIIKLNDSGSLQWSKAINGDGNDVCYSIIQTTDGGYAVAGITNYTAGITDMYVVKIDSNGSFQWGKSLGGSGDERAYSIYQTTDGGYIVAGGTNSFGFGYNDMYIARLDLNGLLQWSKTFGGSGADYAYSVIQTSDGGYAAAGFTSTFGAGGSDFYVVKLDAEGNSCGNSSPCSTISVNVGSTTAVNSAVTSLNITPAAISPSVYSGGTLTTVCAIVDIQTISNQIPVSFKLYQNYPNPFNPVTKIRFCLPAPSPVSGGINSGGVQDVRLIVYNILGRQVAALVSEKLRAGTYEVEWNAENYPSGVYYYQLITGEFKAVRKMVLIK